MFSTCFSAKSQRVWYGIRLPVVQHRLYLTRKAGWHGALPTLSCAKKRWGRWFVIRETQSTQLSIPDGQLFWQINIYNNYVGHKSWRDIIIIWFRTWTNARKSGRLALNSEGSIITRKKYAARSEPPGCSMTLSNSYQTDTKGTASVTFKTLALTRSGRSFVTPWRWNRLLSTLACVDMRWSTLSKHQRTSAADPNEEGSEVMRTLLITIRVETPKWRDSHDTNLFPRRSISCRWETHHGAELLSASCGMKYWVRYVAGGRGVTPSWCHTSAGLVMNRERTRRPLTGNVDCRTKRRSCCRRSDGSLAINRDHSMLSLLRSLPFRLVGGDEPWPQLPASLVLFNWPLA